MWLGSQRGAAILWIVASFTVSVAQAKEFVKSERCPEGMHWCQDRCGTEADTCCQTPDGQHNLCGPGTTCCGFGCCPDSSYICNADYSCTNGAGQSLPPLPNPHTTTTGGTPSETGSNGPVVIVDTRTATLPVVTSSTQLVTLDHTFTLTPPADTKSEQAPAPTWVIVGTDTATLPQVTETSTLTTLGSTFTLTPPKTEGSDSGPEPQTPVVVIDGTKTLTLAPVTQETTVTTAGQTITVRPDGPPTITISEGQQQQPTTTTAQGGQGPDPTSSIVVVDGTHTFSLPPVTEETTVTTEGQTLTLSPEGPPTITINPPQTTTTQLEGSDPTTPVVVIIGTETLSFPSVSEKSTLTTEGQTFTLLPDGPPTITINPTQTTTTEAQGSETTGPVIVIIGTDTLTFPSVSETSTVTTEGQTVTLVPGIPTVTVDTKPDDSTTTTTDSPDETGGGNLPTKTTWPPGVVLTPVETSVEKPEPADDEDDDDDDDDDSAVIPCKLWFFSICIKFDSINILGWKITLPPGIYPPGPPPIGSIKLPPGIEIKGNLPPWPKFTVGPKGVPTFPSEPKPTECQTKTASLCSTSTSYVVSTVDGEEKTISSQALPPTCAEVRGCMVTGTTDSATATKTEECETETVTDVVITCSGTEKTDCSTKTEMPKTGCSVTATTTTSTCTTAVTGADGNVRRQEGDNVCPMPEEYVVWPNDGTKTSETDAIQAALLDLVKDKSKIKVSDTIDLGVNFWRVDLDEGQVKKAKEIPNVGAVYKECKSGCADPFIETDWRYQRNYIDEEILGFTGRPQMTYLSANPPDKKTTDQFDNYYKFDVSAGEGVKVYIVDTGAQIDHAEFNGGDDAASKVEWMFVDTDYDEQNHKDDSGVPLDGRCLPGKGCNPHGTSMLGFVLGRHLGISKKVTPVVVRVPRKNKEGRGYNAQHFLDGVSMVNDAFKGDSAQTRAILSLSWYYDQALFSSEVSDTIASAAFDLWKLRLYSLLSNLIRKGVFVVTGSGNSIEVKGWPALFGARQGTEDRIIPELLVLGNAEATTGKRFLSSGYDGGKGLPHIYGPGSRLLGAEGNKAKWTNNNPATYKSTSGTSVATAYTAGLAAYFLKLDQIGRLGKDYKGNDPDMSPAGLKRYILNNGWSRYTDEVVGDVVGIWNGAADASLELQGVCPYEEPESARRLRWRRQENQSTGTLTGQCVPGSNPTGNPTTTGTGTTLTTTTKDTKPTEFVCTEETADQCAPDLVCHAPTYNGCKDGKCVCIVPDPPTQTTTTEDSKPTEFKCTDETADQCAPALVCHAPAHNGCKDGKCVCILPDPPTHTTTTDKPKPTTTKPSEPETTHQPLNEDGPHCNDPKTFPGDPSDTHGRDAMMGSIGMCPDDEEHMMGPGDTWEFTWDSRTGGTNLYFHVDWIDDCETDTEKQDRNNPLGNNGDIIGENWCIYGFYQNWRYCDNDGLGGWTRLGCLNYTMQPDV